MITAKELREKQQSHYIKDEVDEIINQINDNTDIERVDSALRDCIDKEVNYIKLTYLRPLTIKKLKEAGYTIYKNLDNIRFMIFWSSYKLSGSVEWEEVK